MTSTPPHPRTAERGPAGIEPGAKRTGGGCYLWPWRPCTGHLQAAFPQCAIDCHRPGTPRPLNRPGPHGVQKGGWKRFMPRFPGYRRLLADGTWSVKWMGSCSTWECPHRSWTRQNGDSAFPGTGHWTCGWTRPGGSLHRRGSGMWMKRNWARVLRVYGEERFARRISRTIKKALEEKEIRSTGELTRLISAACPHPGEGKTPGDTVLSGHPHCGQ